MTPHSRQTTPGQTVELVEVDYDPFEGGELSRVVPASEPQRELWLATQLGDEASLAFNESSFFHLRGMLDVPALQKALAQIVSRHDALRSGFGPEGDTFYVIQDQGFSLQISDLSDLSMSDQDVQVKAAKRRSVETPFRLEKGGLFRAELIRLGPDEHLLILAAHHIGCDGWSWWVIGRELGTLYTHYHNRTPLDLPAAASYVEYVLEEGAHAKSPAVHVDEAYWLSRFAGSVPVLDLPTDRPRPSERTFGSTREDYALDAELVDAVRRMGARRGASLFATLLCGWASLLSRITGQDDIVIGIPAAGQSIGGHDDLVGHCVNLLPLRFDLDPSSSFSSALGDAKTILLDAIEHQRYTFGTLLKNLPIERARNRLPLVSVMFNIDQTVDQGNAAYAGLEVQVASNPRSYENFELFVNAVQTRGGLVLECQYQNDLFERATVQRWLAAYETLLRAAVAQPEAKVADLSIVSGAARTELLALQPPTRPFDRQCLMHEHFERQCDLEPGRSAVRCGSDSMTFAELESRANRIARLLRAEGVHDGALVGLAMDRGVDMLAGLLGILKAGAAYVPLDPQFPPERLSYMVSEAGLAALVTQSNHAQSFDLRGRPVLMLDKLHAVLEGTPDTRISRDRHSLQSETPAYVIYTSGSTGHPKGVQVPHRAVSNFLTSMQHEPGLDMGDRLLAVTTLSFDIAVLELFLPLSVGAEIILADKDTVVDDVALTKLLVDSRATVMQATPATWRMLVEAGWSGSPAFKALCGGEPLPSDLAVQLLARCGELWNLYGPTETTVWSTCTRIVQPAGSAIPDVHIGHPVANTQIWVLDERNEPCPMGVPGEIWIGGDGVTLGYLCRPDLTAERFVPDTFRSPPSASPAPMLYRTGDRGRWRSDGNLEHMGRLDFQIKVRGFRIEPGEIENALIAQADVSRAVVVAHEGRPGDIRLVAYVVARGDAILDEHALIVAMRKVLPHYMVPQHVVTLAAIPLLPNGKIDRKELPSPMRAAASAEEAGGDRAVPMMQAQLDGRVSYLMDIWKELLGTEAGREDNFFDLGGHSMLAIHMINRVARDKGVRIRLLSLATQTMEQIAQALPVSAAEKQVVPAEGAIRKFGRLVADMLGQKRE